MATTTFAIVAVAGSGSQFVRRLEQNWQLGKLQVGSARMTDLGTVSFEAFRILAPVADGVGERYLVDLEELEWSRRALFEDRGALDFAQAKVRFRGGTLHLERRDGRRGDWNIETLLGDSSFGLEALPALISGDRLDVHVRRYSSRRPAHAMFTAVDPELRREAAAVRLVCRLEGPAWGGGHLVCRYEGGETDLQVRLDDVDLETFPFEALQNLCEFPWPRGFQQLSGRADLNWRWKDGVHTVEIRHYLATVQRVDLPNAVRYLNGSVTLTADALDWNVEKGLYSQSRVQGNLHVNRVTRRVTGSVALEGILSDRGIGRGFTGMWESLFTGLSPGGYSLLSVELDGLIDQPLVQQIRSARLELEGSTGREGDLDALTGVFDATPHDGAWQVRGTTTMCHLSGFRVPPSTWAGVTDRNALTLKRVDESGPRVQLNLVTHDDRIEYQFDVSQVSMTQFLGHPLGPARTALYVDGTWTGAQGIAARGWMTWNALRLPEGTDWPGREPVGNLAGYILFERHEGITTVTAVALQDREGIWIGTGKVLRDGNWDLAGLVLDLDRPLPSADVIVMLLDHPPTHSRPFRLEGPFLDWKVIAD